LQHSTSGGPGGRAALRRTGAAAVDYAPAMDSDVGVVLTVVSDPAEADVLCRLLRSNGIDCGYRDTAATDSTLEQFTQAGPQEILVHEADLTAARELLPDGAGSEPTR
jgi:hypothetical protein